jgi:hypothetical protein
MRWTPGRRSRNLEDRRAETARGGGRGRLRFPLPMGRGGRAPRLSLGGLLLLLALAWFMGGDLLQLLAGAGGAGIEVPMPAPSGERGPGSLGAPGAGPVGSPDEERLVDFVSFVLDDLQASWSRDLPGYREAQLVLFRDAIRSGCGFAGAQMGPFYCPADEKLYVDLGFYGDLRRRFGAPGDFAQAYVLAHEIGHHVQKLTGVEPQVRRAQRARPQDANALSVRMELQADCLAGVWGYSAGQRGLLEEGDIEEGLRAAAAIGDDSIQRKSGGRVRPESFTHGSSDQRVSWLRLGLESGDPNACDAFAAAAG